MFLRETTVELRALRAIAPGKTEIVGGQVVFLHEGRQVRPGGRIAATCSIVFNPPAKLALSGPRAHDPALLR